MNVLDLSNHVMQMGEAGRMRGQENRLAQIASQSYTAPRDQRSELLGRAALDSPQAAAHMDQQFQQRDDQRMLGLANKARYFVSMAEAGNEQVVAGLYPQLAQEARDLGLGEIPMEYNPAFLPGLKQFAGLAGQEQDTTPAGVREFEHFAQGLTPEERAEAQKRKLGLVQDAPNDPNSFREFELAQQDPAFAAYLAAKRASGGPTVTVQTPGLSLDYDEQGRPVVGFGNGVTKPTVTKTEQGAIAALDNLRKLRRVRGTVAPAHLTYTGRALGAIGGVLDKAGQENNLTRFNADRSAALQDVDQFFNAYRKEITGAAAAQQELEALKKAVINTDLGPQEFERRLDALYTSIQSDLEAKVRTLGGQVADPPPPQQPASGGWGIVKVR